MKLVVEGIMSGNLPWNLVFVGVAITITAELIQIPSLVFAIGLYLPIHLSLPILVGGLVRWFFERKKNNETEEQANAREAKVEAGVLYSSGLIAGEGIVGILLAVFAVIKVGGNSLGDIIDISRFVSLGNIGGILFFALLIVTMCLITREKKSK